MTGSSSPLFILYGSATGNAEHIAKEMASNFETTILSQSSSSYTASFDHVICAELDAFKKQKWAERWWSQPPTNKSQDKHGVIIVISTTGNGDAPENASKFVRYIKRKTTMDSIPFQQCIYAVLGLGDTNYDQFCNSGKIVDKKLNELGGTRCRPLACADEATGLEDVVEPWTETILQEIIKACFTEATIPITGAETIQKEAVVPETNGMNGAPPPPPPPPTTTTTTLNETSTSTTPSSSIGVQIARTLLNIPPDTPLSDISVQNLPSLPASRSSCELIKSTNNTDETTDGMLGRPRGLSLAESASTTSSSGIHYTYQRPFVSRVLQARYLTKTSLEAANMVHHEVLTQTGDQLTNEESFRKATSIYDQHFPLIPGSDTSSQQAERNGKRVLELTLSLPDDYTLEYAPGDSLGLVVENKPEAVAFVLKMFHTHHGIEPDQKISIDSNHPVTVEETVRRDFDLCSPIKNKRILHGLAQHATHKDEANTLLLLASKTEQGEALFRNYVDEQRLTVVDILREFPSCQSISLQGLLGILPSIPPRYYSVCSSPLDHKRLSLTVAFSVVDYMTPSLIVSGGYERGQRRIHGIATSRMELLCSSLLLPQSDQNGKDGTIAPTLKIFPKPTVEFRMPQTMATPLILIGPGTGIAPFMGFLSHRKATVTSSESKEVAQTVVEGTWRGGYDLDETDLSVTHGDASGLKLGVDFRNATIESVDLFFGCRHQDHDWLYQSEIEQMKKEGILENLYLAFSRDDNYPHKYVQDIMRGDTDCSQRLVNLIVNKHASVYVCGDGNAMAKDVQESIVELLGSHFQGGQDEAVKYLETMKTKKRFLLDIWS